MTHKIAKFAAVIALSAGLAATGAAPSRAGDLDPLFGGLIGGGLGAGIGYAAGKSKGAAIGGILGLGLGALVAASANQDRRPHRVAYAAPAPAYAPPPPPPVYTPAYQASPYPPAYEPAPAYGAPQYGAPQYGAPQYSQAHCRQYSGTVNIGGAQYPSYGTACLQPDGTWRIVN